MAGIASASKEQSQGIGQTSTAVTQMDKVTQGTAATAEESASASEELNAQAETMKGAVGQLLHLVDGRTGRSGAAAFLPQGDEQPIVTPRIISRTRTVAPALAFR